MNRRLGDFVYWLIRVVLGLGLGGFLVLGVYLWHQPEVLLLVAGIPLWLGAVDLVCGVRALFFGGTPEEEDGEA